MKTNKFILSILTGSLILTSTTAFLDNSHLANAKRINGRSNKDISEKKIIKTEYMSDEETKKLINNMKERKIITKEQEQELLLMLQSRSYWGRPYVVTFGDLSKDIHIPGWLITAGSVVGAAAIAAAIAEAAAAYPAVAAVIGRPSAQGVLWIGNLAIASYAWAAITNGLVLYYKNYGTTKTPYRAFHHLRIDY